MPFLPMNIAEVPTAVGFDYPAGYYRLKVTRTELRAYGDGSGHRVVVHNEIVMGPQVSMQYTGRPVIGSYQVSEKGLGFLRRLFTACGITEEMLNQAGANVDTDWLVGREYVASLWKNDQYTNVGQERPLEEWDTVIKTAGNAGRGAAQTPAASAPPPSMLQPTQSPAPQQFQAPPQQQFQQPPQGMPPQQQQQPQFQQPPMQQPPQQFQQPPQQGMPPAQMPPAQFQPPPQQQQPQQQQQQQNPQGFPAPPPPPGNIG